MHAHQVFYNNLNLSKLLVEILRQQHLIQYFGCYDLLNFYILQKLVLIALASNAVHLFLHLSGNNPGLVRKFLEDIVKSFKAYFQKLERVDSIDEAYIYPVPNIFTVAEALPPVDPLRISRVDINQRLDGLPKDKVEDLSRFKEFTCQA
jgi:multisubunit Na+/H+ antiporter MnhC subunit